ncbi:MAG: cell division protein FtsQ [Rickettsiales bacterium]|nr:cell division protein FtsQ [Rickettsiales bacterium]
MPYLVRTSSSFHLKKIRFFRSLKIYSWRSFCVLFVFCSCFIILYISSADFRAIILREVGKYSVKFGYVIKEFEIREKNPSNYCINLNKKYFITKYQKLSTILFSAHDLKKNLESVDCISEINVRKIFPSKIELDISYKMPTAIWQKGKIFSFITDKGEIMKIRNSNNLDKFVLINGGGASKDVMLLLSFISKSNEIYTKISMVTWIGGRRWNIIFNNGTKLMLPEDHPQDAWNKFIKLQQTHKDFKNMRYKIIDLRVTNKIYVR